ncbi:MAG: hypothetical protein HY725_05785 [Candidatus Rokubacteria bacterium]|nr:hypothetical protein [Candidatus Rokubacteria bacterium]
MRLRALLPARFSALVEIALGLLLLGAFSLLFLRYYSSLALALVALVAVRNGLREGLAAAVSAGGLYLALTWGRAEGAGLRGLGSIEPYATLLLLLGGGIAFGAVGRSHGRAIHALRERVDELELELADQGVRLLVAIEEKQELEQRMPKDRSSGPGP